MIDYRSQAYDNIFSFFDAEYEQRRLLLSDIVRLFNQNELCWCVSCSFSLFVRGIVDDFHDFDVLVANKDVEVAKEIMSNMGAKLVTTGGNGYCNSDDYSHWQINNCDVDVIAGFRVDTFGKSFYYPITADSIEVVHFDYLSYDIPILRIEPLYILYSMMEGWQHKRRWKRLLIEEYFKNYYTPSKDVLENCVKDHFVHNQLISSTPEWIPKQLRNLKLI